MISARDKRVDDMTQRAIETAPSILVPVDFSPASGEALLFAAQLASCSSLPVVVLHIVHDDAHRPNLYPRKNDRDRILPLAEIAENMLQDFMTGMREQHPDNAILANAGMMVVSGLPETRIPEIACRTGAGLIIMGSTGRGTLSKLIAGSVTDSVIRNSPVPVTVVHANGTVQIEQARKPAAAPRDVETTPYLVSERTG
jgi:nucleotide-binding universal stress UspA family protein